MSATDSGGVDDTAGDTSIMTGGADSGDSGNGDGGADGNGTGGVDGDVCQGAQSGLCEVPGQTVHCYSGDPTTCNVGECAGGTQTCTVFDLDLGEWTECEGEITPEMEVCDGVDNDCDGSTDEGFGDTTCGLGACEHTVANCVDGQEASCDPFEGATDEICDGLDNDCDGDIDEDFDGISTNCGAGVCEHSVAACIDGMMPTCDPFDGALPESCDGLDNDCDGVVDNGFGTDTCGLGECENTIDLCVAGMPQMCDPFLGAAPEICDGLDNDCDGSTDEGFGPISCGVGECAHIVDQCVGGMPQMCDPFLGAVPEICGDGLDNDCDGVVDNGCVCGNGILQAGEQCDGAALGGATCIGLGHDGGALGCNPDCTYDDSGCYDCGDGSVDPGEACDGANLGGQTCATQGFDGGTLACDAACGFDTSGCWVCGDGSIDPGEACDGGNLGGQTCASMGFDGGVLACDATCGFDTSGCFGCGDGSIDPGEDCDSGNLGGATCVTLGFAAGTLACDDATCTYDTTGCGNCGNGTIDPGEQCDGIDFGGTDCDDYGFNFGNLQCNPDCSVDTSNCTNMCGAPAAHLVCDVAGGDPLQAIGLNCPGDATNSTSIANVSFNSPDANAWRVAEEFGTSGTWVPREGNALLVLTTGVLPALDALDRVVLAPGASEIGSPNANPGVSGPPGPTVPVGLPAPITAIDGSNFGAGGTPFVNCDLVNDCSDSLDTQWLVGGSGAFDLLHFGFDVTVPAGTSAYRFDIAWFDSEYPEWIGSQFTDVFVVWSESEAYTGNVMVNFGESFSSNTAAPFVNYSNLDPELAGTGYDGLDVGGATGWYTVTAPVVPAENISLTFALFETGDHFYDATVLVDDFVWDCDGCIMGADCLMVPASP